MKRVIIERPDTFCLIRSLLGERRYRERRTVTVRTELGESENISIIIDSIERFSYKTLKIRGHFEDDWKNDYVKLSDGKKCIIVIDPFFPEAHTNGLENWWRTENKSYIEILD